MLIICDTYDWEDYPHYVTGKDNALAARDDCKPEQNMKKFMELYNLQMDKQPQIEATRCFQL